MRLPIRPKAYPGENFVGYLERLAFDNGFASLLHFCHAIHQPDHSGTQLLMTALDIDALPQFSGKPFSNLQLPTDNLGLTWPFLTLHDYRVCIDCMAEATWCRPAWGLRFMWACPTHGCWLIQSVARSFSRDTGWWRKNTPVTEHAPEDVLALSALLEATVTRPGQAFIDARLPMIQITPTTQEVCRMIASLGRFELEVCQNKPRPHCNPDYQETRALFNASATLLSNWPYSLYHRLDLMRSQAPDDFSLQRVLGKWMQPAFRVLTSPCFQFLRNATEAYLKDHWSGTLSSRNSLLSEALRENHVRISFTKATRYKSAATLREILNTDGSPIAAVGKAPQRRLITFDSQLLSMVPEIKAEYLDLQSSARLLALPENRTRQMASWGMLPHAATPSETSNHCWRFRRKDLDAFNASFVRQPLPTDIKCLRLEGVLRYWQLADEEARDMLHAVQTGELLLYGTSGAQLGQCKLEQAKVRSWLDSYRRQHAIDLAIEDAARALGEKEEVVFHLVKQGLLPSVAATHRKGNARRITHAGMARFREEYIALIELARQQRRRTRDLLDELKPIYPVTGPTIDGGRKYFYRREDLATRLQARK